MRTRVSPATVAAVGVAGAAGVVLLARPSIGDLQLVPTCPFQALTGWDCPLCGGTRAARALLTGDVPAALDHNVVVTVLAFAMVAALAGWAWRRRSGRQPAPLIPWRSTVALPIVLVLLAGFTVVRNLPGVPFLPAGIG